MVGETTNTAQIYKASLGRSENRFRIKKEENKSPVTHALEVSLDRADNIIEGAPHAVFACGFFRGWRLSIGAHVGLDQPPVLRHLHWRGFRLHRLLLRRLLFRDL